MIPLEEKRIIINKLIHPKKIFEPTDIWRACNKIEGKITIKKLADHFEVSPPTLRNSVNKGMMSMIRLKNIQIKNRQEKESCKKAIIKIKEEGKNLTVRELKSRVSVRNYNLLKSMIQDYS